MKIAAHESYTRQVTSEFEMTLLNDTKRAQKFIQVFHLTASVLSKIVENTATNGQGDLESYYLVCDNTLALLVLNVPSATNRTGDPNKFNERLI